MNIRMAGIEDVAEIAALWTDMVNETAADLTPNGEWWAVTFKALMATNVYYVAIAEKDGDIIGFIDGMKYPEPSTGKMHLVAQHFYVRPQDRGFASRVLYRFGKLAADELKVQAIELFCFPEKVEYWQKKGFSLKRCLLRRDL